MTYETMGHDDLVVLADRLLALMDDPALDADQRARAREEYAAVNQAARELNQRDPRVITGRLAVDVADALAHAQGQHLKFDNVVRLADRLRATALDSSKPLEDRTLCLQALDEIDAAMREINRRGR